MRTLLLLLRLTEGNRRRAAAGLALALVAALANIALMAVSGWFLTGMAMAGAAGASFNFFLPAAVIRACAIVRTAGRYLERLTTHEATFRLIGALRARVFRALAPRLPFGLPDRRRGEENGGGHSGDLAARLGGDLDGLQRAYLHILVPGATALLAGVATVAYAWTVHRGAAAVLAGGLLAGGVGLPGLLALAGHRAGREAVAEASALRVWAVDMADGRDELMAFAAAERHGARLDGLHGRLAAAQRRAARLESFGTAGAQALGSAVLWTVVLAGAPAVTAGRLPAPDLVMLAFLALAAVETTGPLAGAFQSWGALAAAGDRVRPLLSTAAPPVPVRPSAAPAPPAAPHIRLDGIRVRYPGLPSLALDGFSLELPPGSRIALVGPSGSGKSTVVALLAGFLEPEGGRMLLDGRPVTADRAARPFAPFLAAASQSPQLLAGSIRRNLRVAAPAASDETLTAACDRAGLGPWLAALPDGLDTLVGAGGRALSGGEARRLAVARALLGTGPVLVLDEPGEGLDPATEQRLLDRLLSAPDRRTVLLITHRPTGLERMDHVVMLDRGRVMEQGPPWTLASRNGPFRRFLERSFV